MSDETDLDYEMKILREAHERPPFAVLWGVDAAEVPHNKLLHNIFEDSALRLTFLKAVLDETTERPVDPGAVFSIEKAKFQENINGGHRLDESLILRLASGEIVTLIIEMKVEAAQGEEQLAKYLADWRSGKGDKSTRVVGLLLRFTEECSAVVSLNEHGALDRDGEPGRVPVLTLSGLCRALRPLLGREGKRVSSGAIHDYYRTCRMLLARERILLADPAMLMDGALPKAWREDNWRWACERLLRGVDAAMAGEHGGKPKTQGVGVNGAGVERDPDGAYLDFCNGGGEGGEKSHHPGTEPGFAVRGDGTTLARGFFKLRATGAGIRLEAQTLVDSYPDAPAAELVARHELRTRLAEAIQGWNGWEKPSRSPGAKQKSGCAAVRKTEGWIRPDQLAETTWSWAQEVLAHVREHKPSEP